MKLTKSNNIGFDFLEYETIIDALKYYEHDQQCFLELNRHNLRERTIKSYEEDIERAKKLRQQMIEARNKYLTRYTNW